MARKPETYTDEEGVQKIRGVVCFMVVQPNGWPIYSSCRRKMKECCMAVEEEQDSDWDALAEEGYRVMKFFASGYDRTDMSLLSIDEWVVEV